MVLRPVHPLMLRRRSSGYEIKRSLRLNSSDSAHLTWTPSVAGNQKTWTTSRWVKRGALSAAQGIFECDPAPSAANSSLRFTAADEISFQDNTAAGNLLWTTAAKYRDPAAHLHIVLAVDMTQAVAANAVRLWVNGEEAALAYTAASGAYVQNHDTYVNGVGPHYIGRYFGGSYLSGYDSEDILVDGFSLDASHFGYRDPKTNQWRPKKYTGPYGTNGFYLDFSDENDIGADRSGNGNNWTPVNIDATDVMEDTPTNNFCTLNPLDITASSGLTFSNGNLTAAGGNKDGAGWLLPNTGKWYWEVTLEDHYQATNSYYGMFGIVGPTKHLNSSFHIFAATNTTGTTGGVYTPGPTKQTQYTTFMAGDVVSVEYDADEGTIAFRKNSVQVGVVASVPVGDWFVYVFQNGTTADTSQASHNFGQRPFAYTPPTGYKALCTKNLPEPLIPNPKKYFSVITRAGTGAEGAIDTDGPRDLVWMKGRSEAGSHRLFDSIRGAGKAIYSDQTLAEADTGTNELVSFDVNGYTVGPGVSGKTNSVGQTYVDWNWRKGVTPGFDIVEYEGDGVVGRAVSHSLGVAPKLMLIKCVSDADTWIVYHQGANASPQSGYLILNDTTAFAVSSGAWNNTAPSATDFALANSGRNNGAGRSYIAYLFAEVPGFSKFGSYTGNGSVDGPMINCGFRPAFVMIKSVTSAYHWVMFDSAREPDNQVDAHLYANLQNAETINAEVAVDFLSSGFKLRQLNININASGQTYIYIAFAEAPFKYANAR